MTNNVLFYVSFMACLVGTVLPLGENGNISQLLKLVEESINASAHYVIPNDNSAQLRLNDPATQDFGTFDFIVVGSGAGGSVVASRLSEVRAWKVLLLEAGSRPGDFEKIVALASNDYFSDYSWGYKSSPQKHACLALEDQRCYLTCGKAFGGTNVINGVLYVRGHPEDFNRWAKTTGDEGWSYERVLPYFKKSENAVFGPRDCFYHGVGGYLTINVTNDIPGVTDFLPNAFGELGYPIADPNGQCQIGLYKAQSAIEGNERVSAARAFLDPVADRANLQISLNSFVTRILVDEATKAAWGVEFVKNGTRYVATARMEVILSAGSYNSPQILMLSGIGPREHLEELDIPVVADLPVGRNLIDHIMFVGLQLRKRTPIYTEDLEGFLKLYAKHLQPLVNSVMVLLFANLAGRPDAMPDIEMEFHVTPKSREAAQRFFGSSHKSGIQSNDTNEISPLVILLHPKSRGTVTLKSNSPVDKPLIDPNNLSDEEDVDTIYRGIQELLRLNETEAFRQSGTEFVLMDNPACQQYLKWSRDWWLCGIGQRSVPAFHPLATNRMGTDPDSSVVDGRLAVHGLKKLRVADASVIPHTLSGHPMAAAIMVGERAADIIKKYYEAMD